MNKFEKVGSETQHRNLCSYVSACIVHQLQPPSTSLSFPWNLYIESESSKVSTFPSSSSTVIGLAPTKLFKNHYDGEAFPPLKNGFKVGMRLEAIDPKHQSLFCVVISLVKQIKLLN